MKYFNGHKTQITGALGLIVGFLAVKGYIDQDLAVLIGSLVALAFGGSVAHSEVKKKKVNNESK